MKASIQWMVELGLLKGFIPNSLKKLFGSTESVTDMITHLALIMKHYLVVKYVSYVHVEMQCSNYLHLLFFQTLAASLRHEGYVPELTSRSWKL